MDEQQRSASVAALMRAVVLKHTQMGLGMSAGLSQAHVSALLRGDYEISAVHAVQVEKATESKVKRWQLRPDLWSRPKRLRSLDPDVATMARIDLEIERQHSPKRRRAGRTVKAS